MQQKIPMTKSKIAIFAITSILLSATMMVQEVYAPPPKTPEKITVGPVTSGQAIPDWVDQNFRWYGEGLIEQSELINAIKFLIDDGIMILDPEKSVEDNYPIESGKLIETTNDGFEPYWIDITLPDGSSNSCSCWPKTASVGSDNPDVIIISNESQPTSEFGGNGDVIIVGGFSVLESDFDFADETIDNILTKGGTASVWEDGIAGFSQHGMSESVVSELQGIVVLCNNAIDKKTQSIDAELKILEQWLEIISEKQQSDSAESGYSRQADDTAIESKIQYNESDLDFITRALSSIDQQINSLGTGIGVLEEKLSSVGDDAQLANIDLQNSLQKQQQTLQTMSNVSKMLHDTAKAIIQNMRA
jgi:hypothetical protein